MKTATILLALLLPATALAGSTDFARGSVLDTTDGSPAQRVTLPDDVYEWVTRADLGDLRVFNRSQEEVPYTVVRPQRTEEFTPWIALPIFPLPRLQGALTDDPRIEIQVNAAGTIVEFAPGSAALEPATAFLFDATELEGAPTELRLDWEGSQEQDFVGRIRIEIGDDLNDWTTLVDATTIARLTNEGQLIELNLIELPPRRTRYFRVSLVEGNDKLVLNRAEVRHRSKELPVRRWKTLTGTANQGGFEFESGGHFPIDRVLVTEEGSASYLISARLFSRERPTDDWRNRGEHSFYRTTVAGQTVASEPLALGHRAQYWRVEFDADGLTAPVLQIGWLPDELVFLTQGPAPYVLAYGRAGVEAKEWPLHQLLQRLNGGPEGAELSEVPLARALPAEMLGGPARLEPPPEPVDWQTIVLWSVLVLGVLLVAFFAFRLLRGGSAT
ncbi:MAG: DUF3999 domain-containing protein [Pseudomonadales bacterium]